tara:strand:- start:17481 stop:18107 length:627 start_codon:yes stop_codon:yes gene_type:complete
LTIKRNRRREVMEIEEMNWTDGSGTALKKAGALLSKIEKDMHSPDEDYYADPHLLIVDMRTGASLTVGTEVKETGKTNGHGYRRCKQVRQRVTAKLPTKKIMSRLLKIAIRNFVPKDAPEDEYSTVVKKAIDDIAKEMADESNWDAADDKYATAITAAVGDILGETWSMRAGDTCTSFAIEPAGTTELDFSKLQRKEEEEVKHVLGDF